MPRQLLRILITAIPAIFLPVAHAVAADTPVQIVGTNVLGDEGSIIVLVFDSKDTWLSDNWRTRKVVTVAGNRSDDAVSVMLDLPPGEYALSIFHDVNDNGKLERNFLGIPKEPAGLSNNVRPRFGPPKFQDATFVVEDEPVLQRIRLE